MNRSARHIVFGSCAVLLGVPLFASAAVSFSEIMYDLVEGGDGGREWVEIVNTGTAAETLAGWKLFEGSTNHGMTVAQGSETIPAGDVAIIADNPAQFLTDNPGFSGTIFDSAFSLSNTGETLVLRNADLADIDTASYMSEQGGAGDGNSLQKVGGAWQAATPTPGSASGMGSGSTTPQTNTEHQEETTPTPAAPAQSTPQEPRGFSQDPRVFVDAGAPTRTVVAGADTLFEARAWGSRMEAIPSARMVWTFGDGSTREGNSLMHRFPYPGIYTVILETTSGVLTATDRIEVTVVPANLAVVRTGASPSGFVEIANRGDAEIDLSYWMIRTGGQTAILPRNTLLGPRRTTMFSNESLALSVPPAGAVELLYPNGALAMSYDIGRRQSSAPHIPIVPVGAPAARTVLPQTSSPAQTLASTSTAGASMEVPLPEGMEGLSASLLDTVGASRGTAPLWPWMLAVGTLALGTIIAALRIRHTEPILLEAPVLTADDFEIIEVEDEEVGKKDTTPIPF